MAVTKAERARVFAMFEGKCAYCGDPLKPGWHIDHLEPVTRECLEVRTERSWKLVSGKPTKPELDVPSNYMPACPPCNIDKGPYALEDWRKKLQKICAGLSKYNAQYRHAVRFGLVIETDARIVFHFERTAPSSQGEGR